MKATCQTSPYHTIIYIDPATMSVQQSSPGFRKKAKDKVSTIFGGTKKRGVNIDGEGSNCSALSLQLGPAIAVGGELGGDIRVGIRADGPQPVDSRSASHSTVEIGHNHGGSEDQASGGETSQKYLPPHSRVHVGRRSSQEGGGVDGERAGEVNPLAQSEPDTVKRTSPPISQGGGSQSR